MNLKPTKAEAERFWPYTIVKVSGGMQVELTGESVSPREAADGLRAIADWLETRVRMAEAERNTKEGNAK